MSTNVMCDKCRSVFSETLFDDNDVGKENRPKVTRRWKWPSSTVQERTPKFYDTN